ncbi:DUF599 domain-containing protein [Candidatus Acetothermia bacterium]|nr:DUF599 domain-containing protein [Candidatus Acetothermia bacterium]
MRLREEDWLALGVFLLCFYGYHTIYFYLSRRFPNRTRKGRLRQAIQSSFEDILQRQDPLLVVHQARNALMAVNFLAGASVILLGALMSFTGVVESIQDITVNIKATFKRTDLAVLLIIATLGISFFSFLNSLRHYNLLTFLVSARPEKLREIEETEPAQFLTELFMRGSDAYTLGRRAFLYSAVAGIWLLNVWAFVAITVFVTLWVAFYDR